MRRIGALGALVLLVSSCATAPSPSPSPTQALPSGTSSCTMAHSLFEVGWDGATDSMAGDLVITSLGSSACVVSGGPEVELRAGGTTIDVAVTTYRGLHADGSQDAPPVVLEPGAQAHSSVLWSNYCGDPLGQVLVFVTLPGTTQPVQASFAGAGEDGSLTPRCDVPGAPSHLGVFPFAPTSEPSTLVVPYCLHRAQSANQRSELNAARSSDENSSGSSQAAKWPPLSTSWK